MLKVFKSFFKERSSGQDAGRDSAREKLLATLPKNSIGAEIGVYKGSFSSKVLNAVHPKRFHLIDPWKFEASADYQKSWYGGDKGGSQEKMDAVYQGVLRRFAGEIAAGQVEVHRAASADAAAAFTDDYFDWVYIDGNHLYEFVKVDLEAYAAKVKSGGYIAGDDYGESGWWKDGVKKAVDEFVAAGRAKLVFVEAGQFCLRKP